MGPDLLAELLQQPTTLLIVAALATLLLLIGESSNTVLGLCELPRLKRTLGLNKERCCKPG
jgi:hypothetical protein